MEDWLAEVDVWPAKNLELCSILSYNPNLLKDDITHTEIECMSKRIYGY